MEEAKLEEELDKERFMFLTVDELEFEAYLGRFNTLYFTAGCYCRGFFPSQWYIEKYFLCGIPIYP